MTTYKGIPEERAIYFEGKSLALKNAALQASPTGFGWGYSGSGAFATAYMLLHHAAGEQVANQYAETFKWDVVSKLSFGEPFEISQQWILEWVDKNKTRTHQSFPLMTYADENQYLTTTLKALLPKVEEYLGNVQMLLESNRALRMDYEVLQQTNLITTRELAALQEDWNHLSSAFTILLAGCRANHVPFPAWIDELADKLTHDKDSEV